MRIMICDDEPQYRALLHEKILQDGFAHDYEVEVAETGSCQELLEALDKGINADVYFLDIQMEKNVDDGIRAGRELCRRGETGLIVYVTGYLDYVQTGYEVRAFRYLLKSQIHEKLSGVLADIRQELSGKGFSFQAGGETVRVDRREILYLESDKRQLHMVARSAEYCFYGSLDSAEKELGERFLRCHRSYLVNIEMIRKYCNHGITLQGNILIPVSRSYAKAVKQRLMMEMR